MDDELRALYKAMIIAKEEMQARMKDYLTATEHYNAVYARTFGAPRRNKRKSKKKVAK